MYPFLSYPPTGPDTPATVLLLFLLLLISVRWMSVELVLTFSNRPLFNRNPLTARRLYVRRSHRRPCSFFSLFIFVCFLFFRSFLFSFFFLLFFAFFTHPHGIFLFAFRQRAHERADARARYVASSPNFIFNVKSRKRINYDANGKSRFNAARPVITYPGILTSHTFDRTDCLDENFVISVARARAGCNGWRASICAIIRDSNAVGGIRFFASKEIIPLFGTMRGHSRIVRVICE